MRKQKKEDIKRVKKVIKELRRQSELCRKEYLEIKKMRDEILRMKKSTSTEDEFTTFLAASLQEVEADKKLSICKAKINRFFEESALDKSDEEKPAMPDVYGLYKYRQRNAAKSIEVLLKQIKKIKKAKAS